MKVFPKTIVADIVEYCTGMDSKTLYNLRPEGMVEAWILDPEKRELQKKIEWVKVVREQKRRAVDRRRAEIDALWLDPEFLTQRATQPLGAYAAGVYTTSSRIHEIIDGLEWELSHPEDPDECDFLDGTLEARWKEPPK